MKCPYCAEEIRDDAIFCRYCSAMKENDLWMPPGSSNTPAASGPKGPRFTMRFAGFFFFLSALAEIVSITSPVSLFGGERSGLLAVIYHLTYLGIYGGMGFGLWSAKPWGFQMMVTGSMIYSADKLHLMMYGQGVSSIISEYVELMGAGGQDLMVMATALTVAVPLLMWWGFVAYVYFKRDYFQKS